MAKAFRFLQSSGWWLLLGVLLLTNVMLWQYGQYQQRVSALRIVQAQPEILNSPNWVLATVGVVTEPPAKDATSPSAYYALTIDSKQFYIDNTLLETISVWPHLLFSLFLIFAWFSLKWLLQQHSRLQQEQLSFSRQVDQQLLSANLPVAPQDTVLSKLELLANNQLSQIRREQEIRHLVKVQGLIDHDLAIGNRIYFESKLQHYLDDPAEASHGALYLVQIRLPENNAKPEKMLVRLSSCAELLSQLTAQYNLVVIARVAEYDLALLLPGLTEKETCQLGDRLAMVLSKSSEFADYADPDVLHLGYVVYQQGQSSYQVLAEADMALKTAQLQGPNAAYGFYADDKPKIKGSVWWRTELSNALAQNRFMLSFQPVYSREPDDVIQQEVLVRLRSSEGDELTAAVFLPMAANCGFTQQIDQYVMLNAARLCQAEQLAASRCSVNLAVSTILNVDWLSWLQQKLQSGEVQAGQFVLELDEYHLLKHYHSLKPKLLQLHRMGFSLMIDHVGLTIDACPYLYELPIDAIKLHPSVVHHLHQSLEQQLFIRGLLASNINRGVRVIACGVELLAEWQVLKKLGVSGAQGFYFSQPLAQLIPQHQIN